MKTKYILWTAVATAFCLTSCDSSEGPFTNTRVCDPTEWHWAVKQWK